MDTEKRYQVIIRMTSGNAYEYSREYDIKSANDVRAQLMTRVDVKEWIDVSEQSRINPRAVEGIDVVDNPKK